MSKPTPAHVDAISQLFTEFELAFHNQFHKAFATPEQVRMAQQLWLNALSDLRPEQIVQGARRALRESDYLPTIHSLRKFCQPSREALGLPDPHRAYIEACQAPSPKAEQRWSHPAVYHAGRESDWFYLASTPELQAFPVFKRNYELLCQRVEAGEQIDLPIVKALPESTGTPLSNEERRQRLQALREQLDI